MKQQMKICNVSYSPGTPTVSIDVQRQAVDDDGSAYDLGLRETVTTTQDALGTRWGDEEIMKAVANAKMERAPAQEALVDANRFGGLEIV